MHLIQLLYHIEEILSINIEPLLEKKSYSLKSMTFFSPINDTVHNLTLFRGGLAEINASCLNALMSHKVCEKRYIVAPFKKALGEAVTERVRIYHLCVDAVLLRKLFQFARNAPCGDTLSTLIEEDKTAVLLLFCKPRKGFFLQ